MSFQGSQVSKQEDPARHLSRNTLCVCGGMGGSCLYQRSPDFLVLGTSFMEDSFSMAGVRG